MTDKLMKRFYENVSVSSEGERWGLKLDERIVRTPVGAALAAPNRSLAEAIAEEWRNQDEKIDRSKMPLLRLLCGVQDGAAGGDAAWIESVIEYLGTDLLCFRAGEPADLVTRQAEAWDPVLTWLSSELRITLKTTTELAAPTLPDGMDMRVRGLLEDEPSEVRFAVGLLTRLLGSAGLALALWRKWGDAEDIFTRSRLDETYQAEKCGWDSEAQDREAKLKKDVLDLARFLDLAMQA